MPALNSWITGDASGVVATDRAALAWRRISDRPTPITVTRGVGTGKSTLGAQTVRVEWDNSVRYVDGALVSEGKQRVTVFGVKDHATVTDTSLLPGDRFTLNGTSYTAVTIMTPPGEVQALCEAVS